MSNSYDFFSDFDMEQRCSVVDSYIDQMQELLEQGMYQPALSLSNKINELSGVSSSVDRASAF